MSTLCTLLCLLPAIALALTPADQVKINEVYFSGSPNGTYQDSFIELYNAGINTAYLDGAVIASGVDTFAQLCFQFPGQVGGTMLELPAGHYLLLAADAHDFTVNDPSSLNLNAANFETFWSGEELPGDNGAVTDLVDILDIPFDLFFYPVLGQVLLATGESIYVRPCEPGEACGNQVAAMDWHTVVDGLEYLYQVGEHSTRLRDEIDAGVILGIAPFSGQSAERRTPGEDSNNSRNDFVIRERPTPLTTLAVDHTRGAPAPDVLRLTAFPNPFNSSTTLQFVLPRSSAGAIIVHDILGHQLGTLFEGMLNAGAHQFYWQAESDDRPLPSGIYIVTLETANISAAQKLILAR